jgi:hypothetical protein
MGTGHAAGPVRTVLDPALARRIDEVCEEGWARWERFDREVRLHRFHPFVPADYNVVLPTLAELARPGLKFLEWGSAGGVITLIADLLGMQAYGIELDEKLVADARDLARTFGSRARFAAGSFLPMGYRWGERDGDGRLGTIGDGSSGYLELGLPLDEFDLVFGYPWAGEEPIMLDVMKQYGRADALFLLYHAKGITIHRGGRPLS